MPRDRHPDVNATWILNPIDASELVFAQRPTVDAFATVALPVVHPVDAAVADPVMASDPILGAVDARDDRQWRLGGYAPS